MKLIKYFAISAALLGMAACNDDKFTDVIPMPEPTEDNGGGSTGDVVASSRDEQYRPQVHFTPAANWMNDPNGMVYADGVWHLYYQYNPMGNDWGNMSWGHATSNDLFHWQEQPVAMTPNQYGDIFSGSAIQDKDNVAGFGSGAILAFYTANGERQQQCLAYSTDGGMTYTQYEGNPIIPNTDMPDFRDPKVFYHAESGQYIMALAKGWDFSIDFWGSTNLKSWTKLSDFRVGIDRCNKGQWECPDLIKLPYKGGEKYVLIVSVNPGGPASGSGTMYFVGDFDGKNFTADELEYPAWIDGGADNYAGVTWSNATEGRSIYIGWMNNWNYAGAVPCNPWRSAMTLPRQLQLVEFNGAPVLTSQVVSELDGIAGELTAATDGVCSGGDGYEMIVKLDPSENRTFTIGNGINESVSVNVNPAAGKVILSRTSTSGNVAFHGLFSIPSMSAPYDTSADELELHIYTDHSSVEVLSSDGLTAITSLVFPNVPYDRISGVEEVSYRPLKTVW
ncbi:MAG: glycoside hydrolase family 32 protein [Muribaculaceae bacterium]|nr:glycoside hydrolase family 32 protein [Muribaculaceae bacterium]